MNGTSLLAAAGLLFAVGIGGDLLAMIVHGDGALETAFSLASLVAVGTVHCRRRHITDRIGFDAATARPRLSRRRLAVWSHCVSLFATTQLAPVIAGAAPRGFAWLSPLNAGAQQTTIAIAVVLACGLCGWAMGAPQKPLRELLAVESPRVSSDDRRRLRP